MPWHFLIFLTVLSSAQPEVPQRPAIALQVSTTQPYVGQLVRLEVRITYPGPLPNSPVTLRIPWLYREEVGFQWLLPPQQWLCRQARTSAPGLPLQIDRHRLVAIRRGGSNVYVLTWHLLMQEPDPLQADGLRFSPVSMQDGQGHTIRSNEFALITRQLPLPPEQPDALWLGVGDYRLEGQLDPPSLRLGQEGTLVVRIHGAGAQQSIPVPALGNMRGWNTSEFRLEPAPETWSESGEVRCFRYRLQPRHEQSTLRLPQMAYVCFDPVQERFHVRTLELPALHVSGVTETPTTVVTVLPLSALPDRLRLFSMDGTASTPLTWHTPVVFWSAAGPILGVVLIISGRWMLDRWRWGLVTTLASRRAWQRLHDSTSGPAPVRAVQALTLYGQLRFGLSLTQPTGQEMAALLNSLAVPAGLLEQVRQVFAMIDVARFAPTDSKTDETVLQMTGQLLRDLERGTEGACR